MAAQSRSHHHIEAGGPSIYCHLFAPRVVAAAVFLLGLVIPFLSFLTEFFLGVVVVAACCWCLVCVPHGDGADYAGAVVGETVQNLVVARAVYECVVTLFVGEDVSDVADGTVRWFSWVGWLRRLGRTMGRLLELRDVRVSEVKGPWGLD